MSVIESVLSKEDRDAFRALFSTIYKGNQEAITLSFELLNIAHIWDDLVDRDCDVTNDQINELMTSCLFGVQQSPLWLSCGLNHHALNVYLRWRDATTIENEVKASDDDLMKCYMLRAGIYDLFVIIAYYLYGDDWAKTIGPVVRKFYAEKPNEYLTEMRHA